MTDHTGAAVVRCERRPRRQEIAHLLAALVARHPTGTVSVAGDNAGTHEDDAVEDVVRAAAGRLVLLYLPTDSLWPTPSERLWRFCRREVTHGARFATLQALLAAANDCFARHNREPHTILSIIGAQATEPLCLYLEAKALTNREGILR